MGRFLNSSRISLAASHTVPTLRGALFLAPQGKEGVGAYPRVQEAPSLAESEFAGLAQYTEASEAKWHSLFGLHE